MKYLIFFILISSSLLWAISNEQSISGIVSSEKGCSDSAMVWLSLDKENYPERLLLMHTEVPSGGSFRFYVKTGEYQVRASDKKGCEYFERVKITNKDPVLKVRLVKK